MSKGKGRESQGLEFYIATYINPITSSESVKLFNFLDKLVMFFLFETIRSYIVTKKINKIKIIIT